MMLGALVGCLALLLVGGLLGYGVACVQASMEHDRMRCPRCGARLGGEDAP